MKIGILSDIHANATALRMALAQGTEAGVESWLCLGDVLGRGPDTEKTLRLVREHVGLGHWLIGNHDAAVSGIRLDWSDAPEPEQNVWKMQIEDLILYYEDADLKEFRSLFTPENANIRHQWETAGTQCIFSHNTVGTYEEMCGCEDNYLFPWEVSAGRQQTPLLDSLLTRLQAEQPAGKSSVQFYGHTHLALAAAGSWEEKPQILPIHYGEPIPLRTPGRDWLLINPGSVGFPRVRGEQAFSYAEYGILDTAEETFTFKREAYDTHLVVDAIRARFLPAYILTHIGPASPARRMEDTRMRLWDEMFTPAENGWDPKPGL